MAIYQYETIVKQENWSEWQIEAEWMRKCSTQEKSMNAMTANSKGLPKEPVYGEDGWNKSNVEQQKQPSDRKSNHCHILTKKKAALWAQICSEAKNHPRPSQNKHPLEPERSSPTEGDIDEMDIMSLDRYYTERIALKMGPDTEIWPVVLVAATIVILFMALAASSTGSYECIGACG